MKFLVIGGNAAGMSAASKAKRNDKDSEVTVLEKTWIPLALRANRAGWAVADNVCDGQTELDGVAGTAVFKVFDLEVARTGLTVAEAQQSGFDPAEMVIQSRLRAHSHPGSRPINVHMIGDKKTGRLLGVQMVGKEGAAHRINAAAVALHDQMTVERFSQTDLSYAPPFGQGWDPLLTAANKGSLRNNFTFLGVEAPG